MIWLKEIAPSDALAPLLSRASGRMDRVCRGVPHANSSRSREKPALVDLRALRANEPVTLLYAARDETHNNAVALKLLLERGLSARELRASQHLIKLNSYPCRLTLAGANDDLPGSHA